MAERVRALAAHEPARRMGIWASVAWGGEHKVDVAQEFGYRNGRASLQVVKRLEQSARSDHASARNPSRMEGHVSSVES